jgi:hypothetical protein
MGKFRVSQITRKPAKLPNFPMGGHSPRSLLQRRMRRMSSLSSSWTGIVSQLLFRKLVEDIEERLVHEFIHPIDVLEELDHKVILVEFEP